MIPLLQVIDAHFSYGRQAILQGISLSLQRGAMTALLGPNGAGKSTLIRLLIGHLHGQGKILWEDRPLHRWRRRELARRVAYLPQSPAFDPGQKVSEVLRMGRAPYWGAFGLESEHDLAVVGQVAKLLELEDLLDRPMDQLSGGQRQRVFIGRCLTQEPAALLLDEPNTYLDLRHQVDLLKLLRTLVRQRQLAVLMASHDLNLAGQYADQLLLMSQGRIVRQGTVQEVLEPQVLRLVYGLDMERIDRADRPPLVFPVHISSSEIL